MQDNTGFVSCFVWKFLNLKLLSPRLLTGKGEFGIGESSLISPKRLAGYGRAWNRLFVCRAVKLLRTVNDRVWPTLTTKSEQMDRDQKSVAIKKLMQNTSNI